jgi:WD40 repeat protein
VADGAIIHKLEEPANARSISFSPDGKILASGWGDGKIRLWQLSDGTLLQTLVLQRRVECR